MLNEDMEHRQVDVERDDEAAEGERDDQDQDEEEDDEGEETQSIKTYVKSTIPSMIIMKMIKEIPMLLPHPKVTLQLFFIFLSNVMLASIKYNPFYLCKLQIFPSYYCNLNQLKMNWQTKGFN